MPPQKKYLLISVFIAVVFLFTTCKKYPDNTLWCKKPDKVLARGGGHPWVLEYYAVNDIDSTSSDFLDVYKEEGIVMKIEKGKPDDYWYNSLDVIKGFWELTNKKKYINFTFTVYSFFSNSKTNSGYTNQRNIFLESAFPWQIRKLTMGQFWISANYNNIKYEIHFK